MQSGYYANPMVYNSLLLGAHFSAVYSVKRGSHVQFSRLNRELWKFCKCNARRFINQRIQTDDQIAKLIWLGSSINIPLGAHNAQ